MRTSTPANVRAPRLSFLAPSFLYTSLDTQPCFPQPCFPSSAPLFVSLTSALDTNGDLPFRSQPLIFTVPSAPSSATGIKLLHILPTLPGPLLAHELPQPLPCCAQSPSSPILLPLNITCFLLLALCPFPGVHAAFPPRQQSESGPEVMDGFQNCLVSPGSFEA